jgi:sugar phosphate isomerase/epimerase
MTTRPTAGAPHPVGLAHLTVIELAPPQVVETAADAGYAHLGLRLAPASDGERQHPMIGDTPMLRETLARLRDRGVAVHDVELVRLSGSSEVAGFEPLLATAAELGASRLLVAGDDADEERLADRFHALAQLAARYGVQLGLEFMPWRGIRDLPSALRVVQRAGVGGVIVDAIHLDRSGGTAADLAALPAAAWAWFQICDAPAQRPASQEELLFQARQARLPPGQGGLDLPGMLRALPPGCMVSIETPLHGRPGLLPPVERARQLRQLTLALLEQAG